MAFFFSLCCLDNDLSEFEVDVLAGELLVDGSERLDLVLDRGLLRFVEVHLDESRAVELNARSLANNLGRIDEVVERVLVHGRQCAASRTLLFRARASLACRFWQDFPLSDNDKVLAAELLLEFTNKSRLDLLKVTELRHWYEQNDGLLATRNLDLARTRDVHLAQLSLQVRAGLQVEKSLRHLGLELRWPLVARLH